MFRTARQFLRSNGILLGLGAVISVAVLGAVGYSLYQLRWGSSSLSTGSPSASTNPQGSASTPTTTPGQSVSVTSTPTPTIPAGDTLVSYTLSNGRVVSLDYQMQNQEGVDTGTKIVGNKIFFGPKSAPDSTGFYVQLFPKLATDSLQTAIAKAILGIGDASSQCSIQSKSRVDIPSTMQVAVVYQASNTSPCPLPYTVVESDRYFLMDPAHPDVLLFFDRGEMTDFTWGTSLQIQ